LFKLFTRKGRAVAGWSKLPPLPADKFLDRITMHLGVGGVGVYDFSFYIGERYAYRQAIDRRFEHSEAVFDLSYCSDVQKGANDAVTFSGSCLISMPL